MGSASTITRKGQVTIPVEIRRKFGLNEGDLVVFSEIDGQIVLAPETAPVLATAGIFRRYAVGDPISAEDLREAAACAVIDGVRERDDA